jgi:hypothetical protein
VRHAFAHWTLAKDTFPFPLPVVSGYTKLTPTTTSSISATLAMRRHPPDGQLQLRQRTALRQTCPTRPLAPVPIPRPRAALTSLCLATTTAQASVVPRWRHRRRRRRQHHHRNSKLSRFSRPRCRGLRVSRARSSSSRRAAGLSSSLPSGVDKCSPHSSVRARRPPQKEKEPKQESFRPPIFSVYQSFLAVPSYFLCAPPTFPRPISLAFLLHSFFLSSSSSFPCPCTLPHC